jgi:hypothetical protein
MSNRNWIQTLQGRKLEPLALTKDMVGDVHEIAHALSLKNRFTGQTSIPYSVAEHAVRGSRLLSPAFAGAFLLHELSEVYLPDIASPLKPYVYVYRPTEDTNRPERVTWADLEREHTHVILKALGLSSIEPLIYSPEIKAMDLAMLMAEKRDLLGPAPEPWGFEDVTPADTGTITPWVWHQAESEFVHLFRSLFGARP